MAEPMTWVPVETRCVEDGPLAAGESVCSQDSGHELFTLFRQMPSSKVMTEVLVAESAGGGEWRLCLSEDDVPDGSLSVVSHRVPLSVVLGMQRAREALTAATAAVWGAVEEAEDAVEVVGGDLVVPSEPRRSLRDMW